MFATNPDAGRSRAMRSEELPTAQRAFKAVFRTFDPFGSPFEPSVHGRLLIYEPDVWKTNNPWGLSSGDLRALLRVADDQDLERVFISPVDPHDERWADNHYALSPLSVDSYTYPGSMDAWPIVPHAIYPPSGAWGVITSDESHALVGGTQQFIDALQAGLGRSQEEMIAAWLEEWAGHQDRSESGRRVGDWIPAQLAHVVGPERAEAALRASRLRRWDLSAQQDET
jgi:hypothetical protein